MEKKYHEFMDEISADELYEGLLAYGLFADKIPPVFTSIPFFNYCKNLKKPFGKGQNDYVTFRVMRNTGVPRLMGIPTPMRYQYLCEILRDNWDTLKEYFQEQTEMQEYRVSRIHIRKKYDEKCIFNMTYKNWMVDGNPEFDLLITDQGASRFLVKADISTCFPSIYTHSIPWAIVGKETAKKESKSNTWYNTLDKACYDMRYGETHGLIIGPHASNLVSEIILTKVDKELYEKGYRYIRNIDDYDCFVSTCDEANRFLSDLEEELRKYDLPLNHKKTRIIELPVNAEKSWKHQLSDIPVVGNSGFVEYPQVNHFIDVALSLAVENKDYAIMNYAIKKLSGMNLSENGKKLATKRFLHMAVLHPYLLHLMEDYVFLPFKVEKNDIKELADTVVKDALKINDYEGFCYAIYFAIRFDFELDWLSNNLEESMEYICQKKDCLLLIFAWLYFLKQNHWNKRATQVKKFKSIAEDIFHSEDMDRYWLFCYEILTTDILEDDWNVIKKAKVSFIRPEFMGN